MKQTLRIFMLLAVAVLTAGQVWALRGSDPVKFVYASEHGTADAAVSNGQVTITISPSDGWRAIDGDVTAVATVANSSVAEARRAEGGQGNVSIDLGETIDVTCTATNVFTLTLPADVNKNVLVTVTFRERLTFTPTVSITGWTFNGYDATTNAPTVSDNTSGGKVTYTYSDSENGTYTETVPTAAGTHYVKATIAATPDYNAAEATTSFTIAAKTTASVSYINADGVLCDGEGDHPLKQTAYVLDGTETSLGVADATTWYVAMGTLTYDSYLAFYGNVNIILADKATLNVDNEEENMAIVSLSAFEGKETTLGIFAQSTGEDVGVLNVKTNTDREAFGIMAYHVNICGGSLNFDTLFGISSLDCKVYGGNLINNSTSSNNPLYSVIIYSHGTSLFGGTVTGIIGNSDDSSGASFNMSGGTFNGFIYIEQGYVNISGGTVNASVPDDSATPAIAGAIVNITGGQVTAICNSNSETSGGIFSSGDLTLGWTNADDFIKADSYKSLQGVVKVVDGKQLMDEEGNLYKETLSEDDVNAIAGKKLTSDQVETFTFAEGQTWMTWCGSKGYTLPEGLEAYTISGLSEDGKSVMLAPATAIAADTPLLLKGTAGTTYTALWASTGSATGLVSSTVDNVLTFYGNPTDEIITTGSYCVPGKSYVLYKGTFLLVDSDQGIKPHRCLLTLSGSSARQLNINVGDATGMYDVPCTMYNSDDAWYDLQGRKIVHSTSSNGTLPKGIYIYNGKKVIK